MSGTTSTGPDVVWIKNASLNDGMFAGHNCMATIDTNRFDGSTQYRRVMEVGEARDWLDEFNRINKETMTPDDLIDAFKDTKNMPEALEALATLLRAAQEEG